MQTAFNAVSRRGVTRHAWACPLDEYQIRADHRPKYELSLPNSYELNRSNTARSTSDLTIDQIDLTITCRGYIRAHAGTREACRAP